MSTSNLEDRVAALETGYAELLTMLHQRPAQDAWKDVVGILGDESEIEQLHQEIKRIREDDRSSTSQGDA